MAAGYPWKREPKPEPMTPLHVAYWRERALQAERKARHNRELAELAREMGMTLAARLDAQQKEKP